MKSRLVFATLAFLPSLALADSSTVFRTTLPAPILFSAEQEETVSLHLLETELPNAQVGEPWSFDFSTVLQRTGVDENEVEWDLGNPSTIPQGLSFSNGTLSGTPTAPGENDFEVIATHIDAEGRQIYTIVVDGVTLEVIDISNRNEFTCAVTAAGAAKCWGNNKDGRLGDGTTTDRTTPTQVKNLESGVTDIETGSTFACAIQNGNVKCWGSNKDGQLARPSSTTRSLTPVTISGLNAGISDLSVGSQHACVVQSGAAKCWGYSNFGQIGDGDTTDRREPTQVHGLTQDVTSIMAGNQTSCAIQDGAAKCWGRGNSGQLGRLIKEDSTTPVDVYGLSQDVTKIVLGVGSAFGCAIQDGAAKCWGSANYGLGDGSSSSATPVLVSGMDNGVQDIAAGRSHICTVKDGGAWCWGRGTEGRLGQNSTSSEPYPVQVSGLTSGVTAIEAGSMGSCAIHFGKMKCWGAQTSTGDQGKDHLVPIEIDM